MCTDGYQNNELRVPVSNNPAALTYLYECIHEAQGVHYYLPMLNYIYNGVLQYPHTYKHTHTHEIPRGFCKVTKKKALRFDGFSVVRGRTNALLLVAAQHFRERVRPQLFFLIFLFVNLLQTCRCFAYLREGRGVTARWEVMPTAPVYM